jgi:hypothetical protein
LNVAIGSSRPFECGLLNVAIESTRPFECCYRIFQAV